jgi:uncharacterized protein involved in outer membrane biogenesis
MKKFLIGLVVVLLIVVVGGVLMVGFFLDRAIKAGIETVGSRLTGTGVKVESVKLSLLSGSGQIKGFVVGNPEGYKTPSAISVGLVSFAVEPRSLLADKVVIKSINIQAPEITLETDLRANNLKKILSNVQAAAATSRTGPTQPAQPPSAKEPKASKKLEVDDFLISGAKVQVKVTVLGGQSASATLRDIHIQGLGKGPEGITSDELAERVFAVIEEEALKAVGGKLDDIQKGAWYMTKDPAKPGTNTAETLTKGLGGFLKKK